MDAAKKRKVLRAFSNGVYILTSRSGTRFGAATVTWVSQASFKPPLVMAAVRRDSNAFKCLAESEIAAIHVLSAGQKNLAQRFFAPTNAADGEINGEPFADRTTSAPILASPPAYVECRVRQIIDGAGDHAIVIMEVIDAEVREQFQPLTIQESPWAYGG